MATALADSFPVLFCIRAVLGFGMGFGLPSSMALLSETTPKADRVFVQTITAFAWAFGYMFMLTIGCLHDATLQQLSWRMMNLVAAVSPFVMLIAACLWLPESAVFLMSTGKRNTAREVLAKMKEMNKANLVVSDVVPNEEDADGALGFREQMKLIMQPCYFKPLVLFSLASFVMFLHIIGTYYAACEVMEDSHNFKKGTKLLLVQFASVPFYFIVPNLANRISRPKAATLTMIIGSGAAFIMGCTGRLHGLPSGLSTLATIVYFLGFLMSKAEEVLGVVVLYQAGVEIPPTRASATGGSMVASAGKLGSLMAPLVFEEFRSIFGLWTTFFYIVSVACAGTAFCIWRMSRTRDTKGATLEEVTPIMKHGA
eukprot:gnl/TRDRNA2_/TRDRNA2_93177_c1_seq1.p1 gnl/TRDRNA2_/TRDRNA2_93177_c1~~gnl/TRDRNA2_/TRDRNA2_93177_c1_seq1.p1  ORF type:complete len:382 (+),score=53.13 gnl/TRDRNA2_/TRDRNA2_93177_c1_seq1:38-1147(+)